MMTSLAHHFVSHPLRTWARAGSETRVPMAIAVIGGVFVSTLFTLFVVPCTYSVLANFESKQNDDDDDDAPMPPTHLPNPDTERKDGMALTP